MNIVDKVDKEGIVNIKELCFLEEMDKERERFCKELREQNYREMKEREYREYKDKEYQRYMEQELSRRVKCNKV